jgi:AraC-like DNA-binding protein
VRTVDLFSGAGLLSAGVQQACHALGYSDAEHFPRFFRSRAGIAPSRYREQVERARGLVRVATP